MKANVSVSWGRTEEQKEERKGELVKHELEKFQIL